MDEFACIIGLLNLIQSENFTILKTLTDESDRAKVEEYIDSCQTVFDSIVLEFGNEPNVVG